jgi:two-component system response regulator QseB
MRLLLVEDDLILGDGLAAGLREAGFTVDWVRDGMSAATALDTTPYSVVVLDWNLPRQDGLSLLQQRRQRSDLTPVLLLTARDSLNDRVTGLNAGADDYLIKPFALDELTARLHALLRRAQGRASPRIDHGELSIDPAAHRIWRGEQEIILTAREFDLLNELLAARGRPLSREQLEERLYGWGEEVGSNAIEVHIHHLRKKLGNTVIVTLRGVGYLMPEPAA